MKAVTDFHPVGIRGSFSNTKYSKLVKGQIGFVQKFKANYQVVLFRVSWNLNPQEEHVYSGIPKEVVYCCQLAGDTDSLPQEQEPLAQRLPTNSKDELPGVERPTSTGLSNVSTFSTNATTSLLPQRAAAKFSFGGSESKPSFATPTPNYIFSATSTGFKKFSFGGSESKPSFGTPTAPNYILSPTFSFGKTVRSSFGTQSVGNTLSSPFGAKPAETTGRSPFVSVNIAADSKPALSTTSPFGTVLATPRFSFGLTPSTTLGGSLSTTSGTISPCNSSATPRFAFGATPSTTLGGSLSTTSGTIPPSTHSASLHYTFCSTSNYEAFIPISTANNPTLCANTFKDPASNVTDITNASVFNVSDIPNAPASNVTDAPNDTTASEIDTQNASASDVSDTPNGSASNVTHTPNASSVTDTQNASASNVRDTQNNSDSNVSHTPNSSTSNETDNPNASNVIDTQNASASHVSETPHASASDVTNNPNNSAFNVTNNPNSYDSNVTDNPNNCVSDVTNNPNNCASM